MDRLKALGRGTQLMFIASVLLLIISFFNWQEVDFDLGPLGSGSAGVSMWDDLGGIIIGILTIVLIARIVARMAAVDVPIPLSFATTSFVAPGRSASASSDGSSCQPCSSRSSMSVTSAPTARANS